MTTQQAPVTLEELGLTLPEGTHFEENNDGYGDEPTTDFESDIQSLNPPAGSSTASPATGEPGASATPAPATPAGETPAGTTADQPIDFEQPAPIPDWQERAKANNLVVTSEAEFRDQLNLSNYIQSNFFGNPALKQAYTLIQAVADAQLPDQQKALVEYDIRAHLRKHEGEAEVEAALADYIDEEGNLSDKGVRLARVVKEELQQKVNSAVDDLEQRGMTQLEDDKSFHTALQTAIRALPADQYTVDEKRALDTYIRSGQYERDALQVDAKGLATLKGAALAERLLENARYLNPVYRQKTLASLYEDARKLGADDFIKKHLKQS